MAVGQTLALGDVILGRRRVATLPQAMLNMAFGQMKHANGVKQHSPGLACTSPASASRHPGLHASITRTPKALNNIAQGKHARAQRVPAPPWVMCVHHNRDERELFHPNTLCRVATESRFALARTERAIEYGRWPNAHVGGRDPGAASRGDLAPGYVEHGLRPNEIRQRR